VQSKLSETGTLKKLFKGQRYAFGQFGRVVRHLAHIWGFVQSDGNGAYDEDVGREFALCLGMEDTIGRGHMNADVLVVMVVLWSLHLKAHLYQCMQVRLAGCMVVVCFQMRETNGAWMFRWLSILWTRPLSAGHPRW
jgi:hypothetical protein